MRKADDHRVLSVRMRSHEPSDNRAPRQACRRRQRADAARTPDGTPRGTTTNCRHRDLGAISPLEYAWAVGVSAATWFPAAAVAWCIWRLFGTYLDGRIFTADAAAWMQRVGVAGLVAVLASIAGRRIEWLILTGHADLPFSTRLLTQFVVPSDLLQVLFCLFVLAVGHVFRTAVRIADDHAAIV